MGRQVNSCFIYACIYVKFKISWQKFGLKLQLKAENSLVKSDTEDTDFLTLFMEYLSFILYGY